MVTDKEALEYAAKSAAYTIGLEDKVTRLQEREDSLQGQISQLTNERNLLAKSLGEILVGGEITVEADMTGPQLLVAAEGVGKHISQLQEKVDRVTKVYQDSLEECPEFVEERFYELFDIYGNFLEVEGK